MATQATCYSNEEVDIMVGFEEDGPVKVFDTDDKVKEFMPLDVAGTYGRGIYEPRNIDLHMNLPIGLRVEVGSTWSGSLAKIHVYDVAMAINRKCVETMLAKIPLNKKAKNLMIGEYCLCRIIRRKEDYWLRAKILDFSVVKFRPIARLELIDLGKIMWCAHSRIIPMPENLYKFKRSCTPVCMFHVNVDRFPQENEDAVEQLLRRLKDSLVIEVTHESEVPNIPPLVACYVKDNEGGLMLFEDLLKSVSAISDDSFMDLEEVIDTFRYHPVKSNVDHDFLKPELELGQYKGIITYHTSPNHFYVMLSEDVVKVEHIRRLMENVATRGLPRFDASGEKSNKCLFKHNGVWERAAVSFIDFSGAYHVKLIDTGEQVATSAKCLVQAPKEYDDLPCITYSMTISAIPPTRNTNYWSFDVITYFKQVVKASETTPMDIVVLDVCNGTHTVDIIIRGHSWNDALVAIGEGVIPHEIEDDATIEIQEASDVDWIETYENAIDAIRLFEEEESSIEILEKCYTIEQLSSPPDLRDLIGECFEVTHTNDYDRFFIVPVRLVDSVTETLFEVVQRYGEKAYEQLSTVENRKEFSFKRGDLVCLLWPEVNEYRRGVIESLKLKEKDCALVRSLDTGVYCRAKKRILFPLGEQLLSCPPAGYQISVSAMGDCDIPILRLEFIEFVKKIESSNFALLDVGICMDGIYSASLGIRTPPYFKLEDELKVLRLWKWERYVQAGIQRDMSMIEKLNEKVPGAYYMFCKAYKTLEIAGRSLRARVRANAKGKDLTCLYEIQCPYLQNDFYVLQRQLERYYKIASLTPVKADDLINNDLYLVYVDSKSRTQGESEPGTSTQYKFKQTKCFLHRAYKLKGILSCLDCLELNVDLEGYPDNKKTKYEVYPMFIEFCQVPPLSPLVSVAGNDNDCKRRKLKEARTTTASSKDLLL